MAPKGKKGEVNLATATEEEIRQMNEQGHVDDDSDDHETETQTDKENRGAGREPSPPAEYSLADPAEVVGKLLIGQNYPELSHAAVKFIFATDLGSSDNQPVIMKTVMKKGLDAWGWQNFAHGHAGPGDPFFVILISESHWNEMSPKAREARLDHHLAQCGVRKKTGALFLAKPDFSEFVTVINRHGLYTNKLRDAGQVLRKHFDQPSLLTEAG
jgi:hypothetical protein